MYQAYGASGPLVVADSSSWVFAGTGLSRRRHVANLIGSEFDGFEPKMPRPPGPVQILAHSPTVTEVSGKGFSDMSYYSVGSSGGRVRERHGELRFRDVGRGR